MSKAIVLLVISVGLSISGAISASAQKLTELKYVDALKAGAELIGKGTPDTKMVYSRLPTSMEGEIRADVWSLGLNSAGLALRFRTDSKVIGLEWTLLNNFQMAHMPGTGIRGMDLYYLGDDEQWHFVGTAQPNGKESRNYLVRRMAEGIEREYMLYLPLYDGVEKIAIGVDSAAKILPPSPDCKKMTSKDGKKPIVFYGTSITQGGCASRPGMVYSAQIGRELGVRTINLGFSGNARMDFRMAEYISSIDASCYVIDCLPNCTPQIVRDSAYTFLKHILDTRPEVPLYLIDEVEFPYFELDHQSRTTHTEKNGELYMVWQELLKEGYTNVYFVESVDFIGSDGEGTVDATHFTDLGFKRFSDKMIEVLL